MDISHAVENGRSQRPVRGESSNPSHSRGQSRSSGGGGGSHMISRDGQRTLQVEDLHEHNKILRHQIQVLQGERDKAISTSKSLWRKNEEMKRDKEEMQKRIEQHNYAAAAQRGQVSRGDHENLAKRYDQLCAQVRVLQHDKEQLDRVQQEKQDLENKYYDEMKSLKIALEEVERDRDGYKYKLSERNRELDRLSEQLAFSRGGSDGKDISRVITERNDLKSRVGELRRENASLQKKLSKSTESLKPNDKAMAELKSQITSLQQQLQSLQQDKDRLTESNKELKKSLENSESQKQECENEITKLNQLVSELRSTSPVRPAGRVSRGSSQEMLAIRRHRSTRGKLSQGSTDDDLGTNSDLSDNTLDLAALTRSDSSHLHQLSGGVGGKGSLSGGEGSSNSSRQSLGTPSSSTSNLLASEMHERRLSEQNSSRLKAKISMLEKSLDESKKENQQFQSKVSELDQRRSDLDSQLKIAKAEVKKLQDELNSTSTRFKTAQNQIDQLNKEKGVAMRDNATSYQQSIQLESQLQELQAEKQILEQQRDIANTERERVIMDCVNLKKKLEGMNLQRHKDAKELSTMRHIKEKAFQEMSELRKKVTSLTKSNESLEEEMSKVKDAVSRATIKFSPRPQHKSSRTSQLSATGQKSSSASSLTTGSGIGNGNTTQELHSMVERLHLLENERKVLLKKMFGQDAGEQGLADMLHKVESLFQERDGLLLEVEALQKSSSKLNEDRIFELKQRIEDILMENDELTAQSQTLKREVSSLSSRLVKAEQDRDHIAHDRERIELQCQQLKSTQSRLVEDHTKTLERVNELWKQKWPVTWDEAWEEKHVTVQLGTDGFAGFSVVGGRDQPHLPNPGAFIITTVNQGGPADGVLKVGDVLESINGINLTNADHRDAVRAVKETKRTLSVILRRRRNAHPIQMGIVSAIEAVPHIPPNVAMALGQVEELEYSLYVTGKEKSDLGFRYGWSTTVTVEEVAPSGPATQILQPGDRIVKVNNTPISREKPSNIKKLMKPHKNILRLVIERPHLQDRSYTGQPLPSSSTTTSGLLLSGGGSKTPDSPPPTSAYERRRSQTFHGSRGSRHPSQQSQDYHGSYSDLDSEHMKMGDMEYDHKASAAATGGLSYGKKLSRYQSGSRESYSSRDSRETYSQDTQSQDSASKPTKLISVVTRVKEGDKKETNPPPPGAQSRPTSDGIMYGNFNERRIEYEEILLSERTDSQYSQSESYLSESQCSFEYGLSSSQSFDLTFHSMTMPTHNRLTVDTVMTTQAPSQQSDDEEGVGFLARDDASRTTFRTRNPSDSNSNTNNSGESDSNGRNSGGSDTHLDDATLSQELSQSRKSGGQKFKRSFMRNRHSKSKSMHGSRSLSKLSSSDQNLARGSSNLVLRGRSRSNLSLGHAPSMTSVMEEPRKSTSTTNVSEYEHDPLADANYIRANFTYIPRNPKELSIKSGDVFHIHDEAPSERFRYSFWVSRLNADGTDEQIGAIPNSMKAQEYLEAQGESTDHAIYEEVDAFTGRRPVLIFGALSDQVVSLLLESYPTLFYRCPIATEPVEGAVRLTEARLKREVLERRVIDFRPTDNGFEVIRVEALSAPEGKNKHCLMTGSIQALTSLKSVAPPITILVKAMTEDSIPTFSLENIRPEHASLIFQEVKELAEQHGHEFSASLFLIYMDTLMKQIFDIVQKEKRKQAWVPITREI